MRALPAVTSAVAALVAVASLSGCGAGEESLSLDARVANEDETCGPQFDGSTKKPCGLEFESTFGVATLHDEETGEKVAESDPFVARAGLLGAQHWIANFGLVEDLPADTYYEVRVPGCSGVARVYVAAEDSNSEVSDFQVNEYGECLANE